MDAALRLTNSGLKTTMNVITEDPEDWLNNHSVSDIKDLIKKVEALGKTFSSAPSYKFDIYDSIRTAISAIPVRFVLQNVIMKEDENNTTSIPWSYSTTPGSIQYFGVSSVSRYLSSIASAFMGEIYESSMPWYLQLLPGLDDPFNYQDSVNYIHATENEISKIGRAHV